MSEFGSDPIAIATVLIRPDTSKFRATLEAELAAATAKPIVVPVNPVATSRGTAAAEIQAAGAAAQAESVALKKSAVSAREAAVAHEQLARGAGATVLSLTGVRGATLAASGPFLAGAAAITLAVKSIHAFSAEAEAAARVSKVFGTSAEELESSSKGLAANFGLSAEAALKFEGAIGEVFKTAGVASEENAKLSESLVKLAVDSAAFNNVAPTEVLRAIQLALSGNLRGLRQFIPGVTTAEIALRALSDTGKKTAASLTSTDIAVARAEVIMEKAANQSGTFAERQGKLAVQTKILESNLANLAATVGGPLSHAVEGYVLLLNKVFEVSGKISRLDPFGESGKFQSLLAFKAATDKVQVSLNLIKDAMSATTGVTGPLGASLTGLVGPLNLFGLAAKQAGIDLTNLQTNMLDLTFIGGTSAQKIANLRKQIAAAQTIIAHPEEVNTKKRADKVEAARRARNAAQIEIDSIQAGDKAAADAAAAQAKADAASAKADAQQRLNDQDQALLNAQQLAQGQIEIAKARAAATKPLADDLRVAQRELVLINQQIVAAQRIHDANLRLQTIQSLTLQSVQAQADIARLKAQLRAEAKAAQEAAAQRRADRRAAALASVDADIEFAQITKNKSAEIRAHEAKIRLLDQQIKNATVASVKWKQLRNERAREQQAIKDLKKETDKRNDAAAELAFSILQEQQGFAGRLLSNLLPTSAVAGTVGGTTSAAVSTPTLPTPPRPPAPTGPGHAASAAAQVSQGAGGATAGQMNRLITLMTQLVGIVGGKKAPPRHPEATYQTYTSSTEMAHPL